jgi:LacI family transcriptional regulator
MVRLKDIALRGGISVMTVSKALRDASDISTATKARVRQLAEQMGYVPDFMAQGLRSRTTKLFGLIVSSLTNPMFARIVTAIEERSFEMGYELIIAHSLNSPDRERTCIRRLLARRVDGLFIVPAYRLEPVAEVYEEIRLRKTPAVVLGHRAKFCSNFTNVETDDVGGSQAATRHLLELGHRKIAFLAGPSICPWAQERFEGYRRALREARVEVDEHLVFNAGATIEEGEKAALQMMNEMPNVTAVQAVNDLVAIGAANAFLNQGIRIPQELSLVGFGNVLISEHFRVPLTTIRQPKYRLGIAAMESMAKLLKHERPEVKRLSGELIVRNSTATAPTAKLK